jgi:PKD repeat protein
LFEELILGDEESIPPVIEFDQVIVYVDSALSPSIEVIYQTDSTLYFIPSRLSSPMEYTYLWTFGDGDSSTLMNPGHTFPAFDSVYRVCLAVTNTCGTYTYCDSIHVDSTGLSESVLGKRSLEDAQQDAKKSASNTKNKPILKASKKEVSLDNIPNPFTESTNIAYMIGKEFKSAEIRITDILGRIVKTYVVTNTNGQVTFDGSPYKGGLYYSSLIVDGVIIKSKTMVIER